SLKVFLSELVFLTETLTGSEGGNITLPTSVGELGLLFYKITTLAVVQNWVLDIWQQHYRDRLLWNRTTGLFTITGLRKDDSGIYTVESKGKGLVKSYNLTVYGNLNFPIIFNHFFKTLNVTSESCFLLCSVDKATEITLRWYKDEEMLKQVSSTDSLLLTVTEQNLSSSYRCEAGNPAENRTVDVDVKTLCSGLNHTGETPSAAFFFSIKLCFCVCFC
uniref:Ig-like domain-containing protein n=1 Tax=Stegastes partitus TaxID=144197 RepID=A0A3B5BI20_9TELE